MNNISELTRAELSIMLVMWKRDNVYLSEIVETIPEPKPAYTTISTVIRTLVRKGFVKYKITGKTHCYYTAFTREEYAAFVIDKIKERFFDGSHTEMVEFIDQNQ